MHRLNVKLAISTDTAFEPLLHYTVTSIEDLKINIVNELQSIYYAYTDTPHNTLKDEDISLKIIDGTTVVFVKDEHYYNIICTELVLN